LIELPKVLKLLEMTLLSLIIGVMTSAAGVIGFQMSPAASPTTRPLGVTRVMTFNIRFDNAADGEDRWDRRKDFLVDTIRKADPDLLGTQEVVAHQGDYLVEQLKDYASVGTGRDDGKRKGEASTIFFRTSRYELVDSGQSWLSETPDVVGSVGWDAALPRIVTWAVLRDRGDGYSLLYANTHFDHRGEKARLESAKLLRTLLARIAAAHPDTAGSIILSGDFNCTESSPGYAALTSPKPEGFGFTDVFRAVHPTRAADEASFHGFKGKREGQRIDWILVSSNWKSAEAAIDHADRDGRFPSDHFPVVVEVSRKPD
jgi:endonuclease/exonuclease/phosphatase family metal-dependent hydrolase